MADLKSPITLIGLGRSGTTLIEKVFDSIDTCYAGGETAGIIFGAYGGASHSYFDSAFVNHNSREKFAASVTRKLFQSLFPIENDRYSRWFHKPAGIPKMINWDKFRHSDDKTAFPTKWYWETFNNVFPDAKYLAVLRNPWEIIASRVIFSGWPEDEGWDDIKVIYDIFNANYENITFLFFEDITEKPNETLHGLLDIFKLDPPWNFEEILTNKYVPTDKMKFNEVLAGLNGPPLDQLLFSSVRSLWGKFNRTFEAPQGKFDFFDDKHD